MNPFKVGDVVLCVASKTGYQMNGQHFTISAVPDDMTVCLSGYGLERFAITRFLMDNANSRPIIELNKPAKMVATAKKPLSSLPIYRAVRKKITDEAERTAVLKALKREYKLAIPGQIPLWNKSRTFSSLFVYTLTPEGSNFWTTMNNKLHT